MSFYLLMSLVVSAMGCMISGADIGQCVDLAEVTDSLPFCQNYLQKRLCLSIPRTVWPHYTLRYRDEAIENMYVQTVEEMLLHQFVLRDSTISFDMSEACSEAYKRFVCELNFPSCDSSDNAVPPCVSLCLDFYSVCAQSTDDCYLIYNKIGPGFRDC